MSSIGKITGTVCRLTHNDVIKRQSLIYCVLNIILFFKIWGATNDIREIKQIICSGKELKKDNKTSTSSTSQAMIDAFVRIGEKSSKFKAGD